MSLSGAFFNAGSGLALNARSAALVSSNISNALTEGYGRRELVVSSDSVSTHGGVRIDGVLRHSDPGLLADRRRSDASVAQQHLLNAHAARMEQAVGSPLDGASLSARLDAFDTSLISASADPSSAQRLNNVAQSAQAVVQTFNRISDSVQAARRDAESQIQSDVAALNRGLNRVQELNTRISNMVNLGRDTSALQDQRQVEIDSLAQIVPLRVIARDRETVALYTDGGAVLMDGKAPDFGFTRANEIAPHMTFGAGLLSGLTRNGEPVRSDANGPLGGGRLAAAFQIRDVNAPQLQAQLDGLARDLSQRFGPGGPDSTLAPGAAGLFTDMGAAVLPTNETGLAGRLQLNTAVSPSAPTQWQLRDGLGAGVPGNAGDASLINRLRHAISESHPPASVALGTASRSFTTMTAELVTFLADARVDLDKELSYANGAQLALKEQELRAGVDSDAELKMLVRIEQSYAANAQVIRVVDELMQLLLR